ncbi:DEAD/DEAH box helicase [Demequina lignilytica]|uniref:DEAD/DEAH box helicase n=1 Tax=Demequina lignilytica TaxID=3051663 RepID=A0AB35MHP4_9MICO|nr:DEAD/DEAH box helicase [Demequina sp. SYSU T0a273]MDN4483205.1 DEAD/DEAH box helicase [Demequina sp. SYSU T0a273]
MSELLPSLQAKEIRSGLLEYLATTFALTDGDAQAALKNFLEDASSGIFKGPFVRLRLPFRPAEPGWEDALGWVPDGFVPYGHQATAFRRLSSSLHERPLPTLVTTGTGSGKTEAFLFPLLDHARRMRAAGQTGIKALILYPMNALANDQAKRLTKLLTSDTRLAGLTAAIYTGEDSGRRTVVSEKGLITDRDVIRSSPPDILLTNYKMLDQLLLRAADQPLWSASAHSLQYLVLDEFHTYDGAQGTDVAMLLRRLGLTLRSHQGDGLSDADLARPLGKITPIATSATLGDKGDPGVMLDFAHTVFGEKFDDDAVVTESRMTYDEWATTVDARAFANAGPPTEINSDWIIGAVNHWRFAFDATPVDEAAATVLYHLTGMHSEVRDEARTLASAASSLPLVRDLAVAATDAISLTDLTDRVLPRTPPADLSAEEWQATREEFLLYVLAALSHVRAVAGPERIPMLNVDMHLWVRELSRIDRRSGATPSFLWSDDGSIVPTEDAALDDSLHRDAFPAVFCRHCGRSGWGVTLTPTGTTLDDDTASIRRKHMSKEARFRALLYAPAEADAAELADSPIQGLGYWRIRDRELSFTPPTADDDDVRNGYVLPILTQTGDDADDASRADTCPSCGTKDAIRFLGSAIATMLSVSLSTLFGSAGLDQNEKKALVFTDSVQDAAHRAGFIETRSHSLTVRSLLMDAVPMSGAVSLDELAERIINDAGDDAVARYRILPPDLVDHENFAPFWQQKTASAVTKRVRDRVQNRLLFDAILEFGLQSRVGRTLELTGSVAAQVDAGGIDRLARIARKAIEGADIQVLGAESDAALAAWVRGVLVYLRQQGGVYHRWLDGYIAEDGNRWKIWGGRPKNVGMPAFPRGRPAPELPRVGHSRAATRNSEFVNVANAQSWYARWAQRALGVPNQAAASFARALFVELAKAGLVLEHAVKDSGAAVYSLDPSIVMLSRISDDDLAVGATLLSCNVCANVVPGGRDAVDQLDGAPCLVVRCPGYLQRHPGSPNFYRGFYADAAMRRIVAREHTSLLQDKVRLEFETGFKESGDRPEAPNVLVATPTLEMGIDIGDLSTVFLSSLPRSVASYLQRVGRAGRLTGNALNFAFVTGRGEQLPRLQDPLSVINGEVRPPATYLDAEEILQRQYIAHLVDTLARDTSLFHPDQASKVMASALPGTFLGDLVAFAEDDARGHVGRFLASFDSLAEATREALESWAVPVAGERSSGVAGLIFGASHRWATTLEGLEHRLQAITDAIPELDRIAGLPAATDDQRRDARAAHGSLKLVKAQIADMRSQWWVGVLEEYGILPNYTLLDDSVELDIALNWVDDEGNYETEPMSYARGSRTALSEFAPGATFYAGGLEIVIDAVDLGIDGTGIRELALCGACGYTTDVTGGVSISVCPRCGDKEIADVNQRLEALEFTRASAEVKRDEQRISDRRDERDRARFHVATAPDIDPAFERNSWYVQGYDFGARYFSRLAITWINLGKADQQANSLMIAGDERQAPLFALCEGCGKKDNTAGTNNPWDHRTWCRHRNATKEHTRKVALTRTLTTQGVLLRLPLSVTMGDSFAVPSLKAAVLLGLREEFGGAPDHIDVVVSVDPQPGSDEESPAPALLLHDVVPGGTGYLADLTDPDKVWSLLRRAWSVLTSCPCQDEGDGERLACHRCLLPFARSHEVPHVSREIAARHLTDILFSGSSDGGEPPVAREWNVTEKPPVELDIESHLEQAFRATLQDALTKAGAKVTQKPGPHGTRIQVAFPGGPVRWTIDPQVAMGGVKPDFMLTSSTGADEHKIAIFTDGHRWHASPSVNRIADDARKRAMLRDKGIRVLAVTAADIEAWRRGEVETPEWMSSQVTQHLMAQASSRFSPTDVASIASGPISFLVEWMRSPRPDELRSLADQAAYYFLNPAQVRYIPEPESSLESVVARAIRDGVNPVPAAQPRAWLWRSGALVFAAEVHANGSTGVAVALDDSAAAVDDSSHKSAWREWLRLSNLFGLRDHSTVITALSEMDGVGVSVVEKSAAKVELAPEWAELREFAASDDERSLIEELAAAALPVPEQGHEIDGTPLAMSWPERRIVVDLELHPTTASSLGAAGWSVVPASVEAIAAAVQRGA